MKPFFTEEDVETITYERTDHPEYHDGRYILEMTHENTLLKLFNAKVAPVLERLRSADEAYSKLGAKLCFYAADLETYSKQIEKLKEENERLRDRNVWQAKQLDESNFLCMTADKNRITQLEEALRELYGVTLNEMTVRNLPHEFTEHSAMGKARAALGEK